MQTVSPVSTGVPHAISEYGGVTPGVSHPPPRAGHLAARRGAHPRAEIITWPGFQPLSGGASRFFVETTGPVTTEIHMSEGRVEIIFHEATVHLSNSRRWLETQFFETPVVRARLEQLGAASGDSGCPDDDQRRWPHRHDNSQHQRRD